MISQAQWVTLKRGEFETTVYVNLIQDDARLWDGKSFRTAIETDDHFPTEKLEQIMSELRTDPIVDPEIPVPPPPSTVCDEIAKLSLWTDFLAAIDQQSKIQDKDWEKCKGIPSDDIRKIRMFSAREKDIDWEKVSEDSVLKSDKLGTDIYFVGPTSSGKSCILASLTNRLKDSGDLILTGAAGLPGTQYSNYLSMCREVSCLPDPTGKGVALTMSMDVFHDKDSGGESVHKWNFVEMAGERLNELQEKGEVEEINPNGWLNTGNAKIINFIIDPTYDSSSRGYLQDSLLNQAFLALKSQGVFDKTTLVNIIVNKFDLEGYPRDQWDLEAKTYVQTQFSALVNSLKQIQYKKSLFSKKKLFEIHVIPFSIGNDFSYTRYVHSWQWESTKEMLEILKANTPHG